MDKVSVCRPEMGRQSLCSPLCGLPSKRLFQRRSSPQAIHLKVHQPSDHPMERKLYVPSDVLHWGPLSCIPNALRPEISCCRLLVVEGLNQRDSDRGRERERPDDDGEAPHVRHHCRAIARFLPLQNLRSSLGFLRIRRLGVRGVVFRG